MEGCLRLAQCKEGKLGHYGHYTRRQAAGSSGVRNKAVEIVPLDSDSEDETLEELEAELLRMVEKKLGRKRSHPETQGKYNAF